MKLSFIKKAVISGLLTISALAGAMMAATPVMADTESMYVSPASQTVANSANPINVSINANSTAQVRGGAVWVAFNPAQLQVVGTPTYASGTGAFFADATHGQLFPTSVVVDNVAGKVMGGMTILGGDGNGFTGDGKFMNIVFRAVTTAGDNKINTLTLVTTGVGACGLADVNGAPIATTVTNGAITVGAPPAPDLYITNVSTSIVHTGTSASTDPTSYNISFKVHNGGDQDAGASFARITIDGVSLPDFSVLGIAAGADSATISNSSAIILTGNSDNIAIIADATSAITESNEGNTYNSTLFFNYPIGQGTDVYGNTDGTITFTQPTVINMGGTTNSMVIGPNSQTGTLNVKSNQSWTVTALGQAPTVSGNPGIDSGKMTKLTGATYNPYVKLHNQLHVATTDGYLTPYQVDATHTVVGTNANVTLTGTAQTLAFGIPEGQVTNADGIHTDGENRTLTYSQVLLASDPSLATGSKYDIPVAFVASATAW